jgi:hypothetical protein
MGGTTQSPVSNYIGLATGLTLHLSATTEDSTTKDTTDTTGQWTVFDVTGRSGDINFSALVAVLTGDTSDVNGKYLADFIDAVSDTVVDWKIIFVSGDQNRTAGKTVCSGKGKLTNLQISAQNRQKASYSGTLNLFGPVTVGSD